MSIAVENHLLLNVIGLTPTIMVLVALLVINIGIKGWRKSPLCFTISTLLLLVALSVNVSKIETNNINMLFFVGIICFMFPIFKSR